MRFLAANLNDPSSVNCGSESSRAGPLFQIRGAESLATSYTQIAHGSGVCGITGCFTCLPTSRTKAI